MAGTFTVGGLASGMDTASIIDKLVQIESLPLTRLQSQQSGLQTQLSTIGQIVSKLTSLQSAAKDLKANGALAAKSTTSNDAFTAAPGASAVAGRYSVEVTALARASKWRSAGYASGEAMAGGTLQLKVQGTTYDPITIADGTSLEDVALLVRQSGAPVSAVVLYDGTSSYLSITARDTGFTPGGVASDALSMTFTPGTGVTGKLPALAETQGATNASVIVDGLTFVRQSNSVADAVPGTTLTLKKLGPAEDLVLSNDTDGTQARLKKFVDAYNDVVRLVQTQLSPAAGTDRSATLAGDGSLRSLQARLQAIVATSVGGSGDVRTLADLGVKTQRDGSLTIDATVLQKALDRNAGAVNGLFSTATSGLGDVIDALVTAETRAGDGLLTLRQTGLNSDISRLTDMQAAMQRRIDSFRDTLTRQFTDMETTVSNLKSIGTFLTAQDAKANG